MSKFMEWVDARFPATKMWEDHLSKYYAPKNFNFWYIFGSLALLVLPPLMGNHGLWAALMILNATRGLAMARLYPRVEHAAGVA